MLQHFIERGLASALSRFLLSSRLDIVFEQVRKVGAMSEEQLQQLRTETQQRLAEVEREGRESLDVLQGLIRDVLGRIIGGRNRPS